MYRLKISDDLAALIRSLHPELKTSVRAALEMILKNPSVGKALKDDLTGLQSFRVKRFKIIYRVDPRKIIALVAIGPRRTIYEQTYRLVSKGSHGKK